MTTNHLLAPLSHVWSESHSSSANRSSNIKGAHDDCEKSWWCGPFSGWKPERFSSLKGFEGILACVHTKGAESYLHFFSHSLFSDQTSIAETQRSLSPSMKMNVCSSRKGNSGADFETVVFRRWHCSPGSTCPRGSTPGVELFHKWQLRRVRDMTPLKYTENIFFFYSLQDFQIKD